MLDPTFVAHTLKVPQENVNLVLPLVADALITAGLPGILALIGAAATIGVETPAFFPVKEKRANKDRQPDLWLKQERYWKSGYMGRGLVQLTWLDNYKKFDALLNLDIAAHPDDLMIPDVSAKVLAGFFKLNHIDTLCEAQNWPAVRRAVNGGLTDFPRFQSYVLSLIAHTNKTL